MTEATGFEARIGHRGVPPGGAHRDPAAAIASTGEAIANALEELAGLDRETVRRQRREKFLAIGRTWG